MNALARPKLSANAPITALIAPLAPIIGVAAMRIDRPLRSRRGIGADDVEHDQARRAEHALDLRPAPDEHQQVEAEVDEPGVHQRRGQRRQERRHRRQRQLTSPLNRAGMKPSTIGRAIGLAVQRRKQPRQRRHARR